jgi:hypothetical protein
MPQAAGTGSGTETAITTEYLAMRLDCLIELLQDCLGVTGDGGDDASDLQSFDGDNVILPTADNVGDSSTTRIAKAGNLADEGGDESIGGLLITKGGNRNLDAGACDSMADQREERSPLWTYACCPDIGLDKRDGHNATVSDVLDAVSDKFGLSTASILFVFTNFTV